VSRAAERVIFNIVGRFSLHVGKISRANNVEGGNSREARPERHVHTNDKGRGISPGKKFLHSLRSVEMTFIGILEE